MTFFFFQAEDGIRDYKVTGVQTCALPIYVRLQPFEQLQRLLPGARHLRLIAVVGQKRLGRPCQRVLVVDDQDRRAAHARLRTGSGATSPLATGSQRRTVVPRPTVLTISNRPPASSM